MAVNQYMCINLGLPRSDPWNIVGGGDYLETCLTPPTHLEFIHPFSYTSYNPFIKHDTIVILG